jgi:hypothetical protein
VNVINRQNISVAQDGDKETKLAKINASPCLFSEVDLKDVIELKLATQMLAVNEMAAEMSSRELLKGQSEEWVDTNINRATKLIRTFATLVETLKKYRNKGEQKITVQHVLVNDGGKAIVGDVKQGG